MVVLIDANVVLDYITSREPYYRESYKIIDLCYSGKVKGYIAFHSVSIIWYTLRRYIPDKYERRKWILRSYGTTLFFHKVLSSVFNFAMDDMELIDKNPCRRAIQRECITLNHSLHHFIRIITPLLHQMTKL